jgi:sulfite exporter TauE/SafE
LWTDLSLGFALGVAGGMHCVQMCGPLAIAVTAPLHASPPPIRTLAVGAYHAGRILTYSFLGAAAGLLGRSITELAMWKSTAALVAGILMVLAGVVMFGIFRRPALVQIEERGWLSRTAGRMLLSTSAAVKLGTGMLLGLLPCGLIYAALLKAMGTGEWLAGAATMAGFGIATSLPLLGMGLVSGVWMRKHAALGMKLTAIAIVLMGVILVWRGLNPVTVASHLHHH